MLRVTLIPYVRIFPQVVEVRDGPEGLTKAAIDAKLA